MSIDRDGLLKECELAIDTWELEQEWKRLAETKSSDIKAQQWRSVINDRIRDLTWCYVDRKSFWRSQALHAEIIESHPGAKKPLKDFGAASEACLILRTAPLSVLSQAARKLRKALGGQEG